MSVQCEHPPTGTVACPPGEDRFAQTPVCSAVECVDEALDWVRRWSGKAACHTLHKLPAGAVLAGKGRETA